LRLARERARAYRTDASPPELADRPKRPSPQELIDKDLAAQDLDDAGSGEEATEEDTEEETPQTLDEWLDVVSRRVDDAMRRGLFDNLPGQGKPQLLRRDPFVPEDQQMAYSLMKKNQITPGWIGDRKAILAAIAALREEIGVVGAVYMGRLQQVQTRSHANRLSKNHTDNQQTGNKELAPAQLAAEWNFYVNEWDERIKLLNKQIVNLNLSQPFHYLEIYQLRLHEELKRAGMERTLRV